jgi:arylformamidase
MENSNKKIYLSHYLSETTPGYGGSAAFFSMPISCICNGDSSNSQFWKLSNHIGTHVDLPRHFSETGATIDSYGADFWWFEFPYLQERAAEQGELISVEAWIENIPKNCDLLLIKTGFEKYRLQDHYWSSNPGLTPELGKWLRQNRPSVRAVGFDLISLTSYLNRPLGRVAHRAFLDPLESGKPIVLVEDMSLKELHCSPKKVWISPLRVEGADGTPVTVFAEIR